MYKHVYGQSKLVNIMSLELYYNPPGIFGKYMSTFEYICGNLEARDQGLIEYQKHTFTLSEIEKSMVTNYKKTG